MIHCVDECSTFQLAKRTTSRTAEDTTSLFQDFWMSWAGAPDPAGEFTSQVWMDFLQANSITSFMSSEAWQKGRIERHGQVLKQMLHRVDQDRMIRDLQDFDRTLAACCMAKNQMARHKGYSPEQIVLGKATRIPGSLTGDETTSAHTLQDDNPETSKFRETLTRRNEARIAFLEADNHQAIRRALLRRSCPVRGPFHPGQSVMYWFRRKNVSRGESGRWYGPARVIQQEGQSTVWLSHQNRVIRCPPENLRPMSLREWNQNQTSANPTPLTDNPANSRGTAVDADTRFRSLQPHHTSLSVPPTPDAQPEREITPNIPLEVPELPPSTASQPLNEEDTRVMGEAIDLDPDPPVEENDEEQLMDQADFMETEVGLLIQCLSNDFAEPIDHMSPNLVTCETAMFGEAGDSCLLADDEFAFVAETLQPTEEEGFALEIPLTDKDLIAWASEDNPEQMAHVATAGKRARAEVQLKKLSHEEKQLFVAAKDLELSCWLQTNAIRPILRQKLNPEQILISRWVLTWKESDDPRRRKAKARLVVLGFMDPRLCEVERDAPTLTKEGRTTILQCIASMKWNLCSFDITTAFLRGKADASNPLAMEPPEELRRKMQLKPTEICQLVGNAYGRVDAPLLFYRELTKHLRELNFQTHPLEPCVHFLSSGKGKDFVLHGVLGTHVDDGLGGGDQFFRKQLKELERRLPFGSFKERKFKFTGIDLEQQPDGSISASQEAYVHGIMAIDIGKNRREQPESDLTETELSIRGIIGSIQYAVTQTRPDIASRLGEVQCQLSKPTVGTMLLANKVLREAQEHSDTKIWFRSITPEDVTHISFGDASFASPKNLSSFQGLLICATSTCLDQNRKGPLSPLIWSSKKISRVVRSTISAEAFSMSQSVDRLSWMRLLWGCLLVPEFNWRCPPEGFKQLNRAIITTDCKSLFDLATRTAIPTCEEYRTTLEVLLIRERCAEHAHFRWLPTTLMLADALTKVMDSDLLRTTLRTAQFQIFDETAVLRYNAHRKQALKWLNSDAPA